MKKYIVMSVLMSGIFLFSACNSKTSGNADQSETTEVASSQKTQDEHAMITVQGACEMCKDRIEKAAKSIEGVSSAEWDLKTKELHVNFNPAKTNIDAISQAIAKAGHDTDNYKADDSVYNNLPKCCKYR